MAHPTDHLRTLRGDEAELFDTYELALRCAVAHAVRADDATIQDACSFAWLQLLRRQPDRTTVFAWLRTVATREAWRLTAREHRDQPLDDHTTATPHAAGLDEALDARDALRTLAGLPQRQRHFLTLAVSGHSYDEIAHHCHTSTTSVNKHLHRARHHLKAVRDAT